MLSNEVGTFCYDPFQMQVLNTRVAKRGGLTIIDLTNRRDVKQRSNKKTRALNRGFVIQDYIIYDVLCQA